MHLHCVIYEGLCSLQIEVWSYRIYGQWKILSIPQELESDGNSLRKQTIFCINLQNSGNFLFLGSPLADVPFRYAHSQPIQTDSFSIVSKKTCLIGIESYQNWLRDNFNTACWGKKFSRHHFEIFFLFFPENWLWNLGDNLYEIRNLGKISICHLPNLSREW